MEKILLVEPNYKNKYPPIGLMKISTYYKSKGDFVQFHKGLMAKSDAKVFDKVMITTLFTFDFEVCVQTIKYYSQIVGINKVFVGGVAATIMPEKFRSAIPGVRINTNQLTSSNMLGYTDGVNIDVLPLDYDMLWDISYEYPAADSYFVYTTRGCPRKCPFCAVKTLEPIFYNCDNIEEQINSVNDRFGVKKNLLIMDNNILYSKHFGQTVDTLVRLGFGKNNNTTKKNSRMRYYLNSLEDRIKNSRTDAALLLRIREELHQIKTNRISKKDIDALKVILDAEKNKSDYEFKTELIREKKSLSDFFERYHFHKITRYVDFNQGLDARLFTDELAEKMGELAVNPCRIAFDHADLEEEYLNAMKKAVAHGITSFSNYLLYNYKDDPKDLWKRLWINIQFCEKNKKNKVSLFSFPMKYAAIDQTDRSYVGEKWNKKYLRAMNVILNVTSGVVAKEKDFFQRAYGKTSKEFMEILAMPDEFIRYRDFFEKNEMIDLWKSLYGQLSKKEKDELIDILSRMVDNPGILEKKYSNRINEILWFYKLKKKAIECNELFYKKEMAVIQKKIAG